MKKAKLLWVMLASAVSTATAMLIVSCTDEESTATSTDAGGSDATAKNDTGVPDSAGPQPDSGGDAADGGYFVTITSPLNNATIDLPANGKMPVSWTTNLNFAPPFRCGDAGADGGPLANCGHAHLTIDGTACNSKRTGTDGGVITNPFNAQFTSTPPANADFTWCQAPQAGPHTLVLELRQDTHAPLNPVVSSTINITVTVPDGGLVRDGGQDASDAATD